jgi:hypothetical protein
VQAEQTDVLDLDAQAADALEAARKLPHRPARSAAIRKARQLRLVADARRAGLEAGRAGKRACVYRKPNPS